MLRETVVRICWKSLNDIYIRGQLRPQTALNWLILIIFALL